MLTIAKTSNNSLLQTLISVKSGCFLVLKMAQIWRSERLPKTIYDRMDDPKKSVPRSVENNIISKKALKIVLCTVVGFKIRACF